MVTNFTSAEIITLRGLINLQISFNKFPLTYLYKADSSYVSLQNLQYPLKAHLHSITVCHKHICLFCILIQYKQL